MARPTQQTVDAVVLRDEKEVPVKITLNKNGKLGVIVGSLGVDSLKTGIYKFTQQQYGFLNRFLWGLNAAKTNWLIRQKPKGDFYPKYGRL
jgi:regulator of sigma E protease